MAAPVARGGRLSARRRWGSPRTRRTTTRSRSSTRRRMRWDRIPVRPSVRASPVSRRSSGPRRPTSSARWPRAARSRRWARSRSRATRRAMSWRRPRRRMALGVPSQTPRQGRTRWPISVTAPTRTRTRARTPSPRRAPSSTMAPPSQPRSIRPSPRRSRRRGCWTGSGHCCRRVGSVRPRSSRSRSRPPIRWRIRRSCAGWRTGSSPRPPLRRRSSCTGASLVDSAHWAPCPTGSSVVAGRSWASPADAPSSRCAAAPPPMWSST